MVYEEYAHPEIIMTIDNKNIIFIDRKILCIGLFQYLFTYNIPCKTAYENRFFLRKSLRKSIFIKKFCR